MKAAFPTIMTQSQDAVLVEVPDLEVLTEGKDLEDAIEMARDAIGIKGISMQDAGKIIPEPSNISKICIEDAMFFQKGSSIVTLVDIDFDAYRRKVDTKMVRRTVTLPEWLNRAAEAAGFNVSRVLQDALQAQLGITGSPGDRGRFSVPVG